jgi:hypothetical protein
MSGVGKVFLILGVVVLLVGLAFAAFYLMDAGQQAEQVASNLSALATGNAQLATEVVKLEEWSSYQSTQIGAHQLALNDLTGASGSRDLLTITPTEYVVSPTYTLTPWDRPVGVMIEEGGCCVGGTAGETIEVTVQFLPEQTDLAEPAVEMRVITGVANVTAADMVNQPWGPVVEEVSYQVYLAINWTTFWVHVQYRTADGAVSAVYSDEIGVEGMPGITATP